MATQSRSADRFKQISRIFYRALELPPEQRGAYVNGECGDDRDLFLDVTSLLERAKTSPGFLSDGPEGIARALEEGIRSLVGRQVGRYHILARIGGGGMGEVYKAHHVDLDRIIAIKLLPTALARDPVRLDQLRDEARVLAKLSHPGIPTVHDILTDEGELFIVSELIEGRSLREVLREDGPLPLDRLLKVAIEAADALRAAHGKHIVHRDIKPENIMLSHEGRAKVIDFGLAILPDVAGGKDAMTTMDSPPPPLAGTPAYMSPEQLRLMPVDFRTDLFSLGEVIYEAACGAHPFEGIQKRILLEKAAELAPRLGREYESLDRILEKCLAKAPQERYQETSDLVRALEEARHRSGVVVPPPPQPRGAHLRDWQVHQILVSLVLAVLLYPWWLIQGFVRPASLGQRLYMVILAATVVDVVIRLNLVFASVKYKVQTFLDHRARFARWVRLMDVVFTLAILALGVVLMLIDRPGTVVFVVLVAAAYVVTFSVIEPATTKEMLREIGSRRSGPRQSPPVGRPAGRTGGRTHRSS